MVCDWHTNATIAATTVKPPDTSSRTPETLGAIKPLLGVYRDPWFWRGFGCDRDGGIVFASAKSPQLTGKLMRIEGGGLLVDWDQDDIDTEAWLDFRQPPAAARAVHAQSGSECRFQL